MNFKRLYYAGTAVFAFLAVALLFGRQLSFFLYGFDQSLIDSASAEAFQAYSRTNSFRTHLFQLCSFATLLVFGMSLISLAFRRRLNTKRILLPLIILVLSALAGLALFMTSLAPTTGVLS